MVISTEITSPAVVFAPRLTAALMGKLPGSNGVRLPGYGVEAVHGIVVQKAEPRRHDTRAGAQGVSQRHQVAVAVRDTDMSRPGFDGRPARDDDLVAGFDRTLSLVGTFRREEHVNRYRDKIRVGSV